MLESLRKLPFLVVLIALILVVLVELASLGFLGTVAIEAYGDLENAGYGIRYLALLNGQLLFTVGLMALSLVIVSGRLSRSRLRPDRPSTLENMMNIKQLSLVAACIVSLNVGGCGKEEPATDQASGQGSPPTAEPTQPPGPSGRPETAAATEAGDQPSSAVPSPTDMGAGQQMTEAEQDLTGELQEFQNRVDELQQKISAQVQEGRESLNEQLQALKRQREELEEKANEVAASGVGRVNELLGRLNQKLNGLTRSVEQATLEETPAAGGTAPSSTAGGN